MKRCPQCNRVETDDALVFCRTDGARLTSESDALYSSQTLNLPSSTSGEFKTEVLLTSNIIDESRTIPKPASIAVLPFTNMSADPENE